MKRRWIRLLMIVLPALVGLSGCCDCRLNAKSKDNAPIHPQKLPGAVRGFSGVVEGHVESIEELGFRLRVEKAIRVWANNRSAQPELLEGKTWLVNAQWEKADNGPRPVPQHKAFIASLKPGELLQIEIINDELDRLHILELSQDQRNR